MKPILMTVTMLLAILILSVPPFSADPVSAQISPFYWESINVEIDLQEMGTC